VVTACPTLTTECLVLRPFEEPDLDRYTDMLTTPEVRHSLRLADGFSRRNAWLGMVWVPRMSSEYRDQDFRESALRHETGP
jgi:RimJ/RimL family protein N-acetyltransferase